MVYEGWRSALWSFDFFWYISVDILCSFKQRNALISNIYALGPKEYASIPGYLQHAQVGIIPFDVKGYAKLIDAVNPLKLYEYMASSLPVVATRWKELEYLNSPAYLADSFEEFERALEKALAFPPQSVREYVEKQDWSFRAKELIELLR